MCFYILRAIVHMKMRIIYTTILCFILHLYLSLKCIFQIKIKLNVSINSSTCRTDSIDASAHLTIAIFLKPFIRDLEAFTSVHVFLMCLHPYHDDRFFRLFEVKV